MSDFNLEDLPEPGGATFVATFNSHCDNCGMTLQAGQEGRFEGDRAVHVKCPEIRKACPICWLVHGTHQEDCDG